MGLSKSDILAYNDLPVEVVKVPEWGANASVTIRSFSVSDGDTFGRMLRDGEVSGFTENLRERVAAFSIIDETTGELMFTDDVADITALGKKSPKALNRVFDAAMKLNALKSDEESEKN
jgi:hypothetical protein